MTITFVGGEEPVEVKDIAICCEGDTHYAFYYKCYLYLTLRITNMLWNPTKIVVDMFHS